jgi:hypothetical protein
MIRLRTKCGCTKYIGNSEIYSPIPLDIFIPIPCDVGCVVKDGEVPEVVHNGVRRFTYYRRIGGVAEYREMDPLDKTGKV